jgi:phosphoenolpyruvate carboxylase
MVINELLNRLASCQKSAKTNPLSSPYQLLGLELSDEISCGAFSEDAIDDMILELTATGLISRTDRAREYIGQTKKSLNRKSLNDQISAIAGKVNFAEFSEIMQRQIVGIVLTAHPTFGFPPDIYKILSSQLVSGDTDQAAFKKSLLNIARPDEGLTLAFENDEAKKALKNLKGAMAELYNEIFKVAQKYYPNDFTSLKPKLMTVATWVGFDLDGRNDITWLTSLNFRYQMALAQYESYVTEWQEIENLAQNNEDILGVGGLLQDQRENYKQDLENLPSDPDDLPAVHKFSSYMAMSRAGNAKTSIPASLDHIIDKNGLSDDLLARLLVFRAKFLSFKAGTAHIHFRLNSVQLHNAVRPLVTMEKDPDAKTLKRRYLTAISKLLDKVEPQTVGFENVAVEMTSAKRLFMLVQQFQKYIDVAAPIRFLIAESDTPFTVLAALYYARLFGVEDTVDISPLFETDVALERGAKIIEELLENPHYLAYVKSRGRLCVQAGYSDAGRFMGQIPAGMGIERLRMKLMQLWRKFDLQGVELVMFDTGGESIGRGAHPDGFGGRLGYMHSPASRDLALENNIAYKQEFALQGGDGFFWLSTPEMALATLTRVIESELEAPTALKERENDLFYQDTDWSLDFFLSIKEYHTNLANDPDFLSVISCMGPNIMYPSGSRMTIRSEAGSTKTKSLKRLSQIRAIPNNALLHQLGYLNNTVGGLGGAIARDPDAFQMVYENSGRLRHIMRMVGAAQDVTDIDIFKSYVRLFDPLFWLDCMSAGTDKCDDHKRMGRLANHLDGLGIDDKLRRQLRIFRQDDIDLKFSLDLHPDDKPSYQLPDDMRQRYKLLHVLRLALIQRIFILVTRIPRFSNHQGVTVRDLVREILKFNVDGALKLLREIYPVEVVDHLSLDNPENATYKGDYSHGYEYENKELFDKIERHFDRLRKISMGLSSYIGSMG